jgi:hypothetical protein
MVRFATQRHHVRISHSDHSSDIAGISRPEFATKAPRAYAHELRRRSSPVTKALGSTALAEEFAAVRRKVSKAWWAKLTPAERKARAQRAINARWERSGEVGLQFRSLPCEAVDSLKKYF